MTSRPRALNFSSRFEFTNSYIDFTGTQNIYTFDLEFSRRYKGLDIPPACLSHAFYSQNVRYFQYHFFTRFNSTRGFEATHSSSKTAPLFSSPKKCFRKFRRLYAPKFFPALTISEPDRIRITVGLEEWISSDPDFVGQNLSCPSPDRGLCAVILR